MACKTYENTTERFRSTSRLPGDGRTSPAYHAAGLRYKKSLHFLLLMSRNIGWRGDALLPLSPASRRHRWGAAEGEACGMRWMLGEGREGQSVARRPAFGVSDYERTFRLRH